MSATVTVRVVRPEEYQTLATLTLDAYRALLGPDMDGEYAAELTDVATRASSRKPLSRWTVTVGWWEG